MSQYSASHLSAQPPELLDHICSYIGSTEDLLALSLTSKQFCALIIPNHIEFRRIRCDIRLTSVWKRLANSPVLGAKFSSLEVGLVSNPNITPFRRAILPKYWIGSIPSDELGLCIDWPPAFGVLTGTGAVAATIWLAYLVTAIHRMPSLTRFRWAVESLPPSNDVLLALKNSCPGLVDVEIANTGMDISGPSSDPTTLSSPLWQYSNLSRFSFTLYNRQVNEATASAYVSKMLEMLVNRCPRLECIHLRLNHARTTDLTQFFERGHWPMLIKLSIGGDLVRPSAMTLPNSDIMNQFLRNHPTLERLYLCPGSPQFPSIEMTDTVPLRAIDIPHQALDIQRFGPAEILQFEYLATVNLSRPHRDRNLHVLSQMSSLRELVVQCDILSPAVQEGLVKAIPLIEKLRFEGYHGEGRSFFKSELMDPHGKFLRLCGFLSRLPHLTHLSSDIGVAPPYDWEPAPGARGRFLESHGLADADLVLSVVAGVSPNLRYMDMIFMEDWVSGQMLNFEIMRAKYGAYCGWSTDEKPRPPWGGLYIGGNNDLL